MRQKLIQIAEDCPVDKGIIPIPKREKDPIYFIQFEELVKYPYGYDEKIFHEQVNLVRRVTMKK